MTRRTCIADLFCGAGGTSTGAIQACVDLGHVAELTAVNHWAVAVATHTKNHPGARHLCASLDALNPRALYKDGELDLLLASPECTHHSVARGGMPMNDQSRATAWCVIRWAEALRPGIVLVENVKEFQSWGPIGSDGKPIKSKAGETFQAWVNCLTSLGYKVEWKVLCAADYGDPTTRRRLFVQAVRGRRKPTWPAPSHMENAKADLFGAALRKPWRQAREIIDWDDEGYSIYDRKKPLAEKTLKRIQIGLEKFGGPFMVHLRGMSVTASLDRPAPTVTSGGGHLGLVEPFLIETNHGGDRRPRAITEPLPTVMCGHDGGDGRNLALCEPYLIAIDQQSGSGSIQAAADPLSAVTTKQRHAVCQPFLVKFNGTAGACSVAEPLDTVTSKDRFGLARPMVEIDGTRYLLDIKFRMLKPIELARAQGFPTGYQFTGNQSQVVKQIGNAVPVNLSKAIVKAVLQDYL